MRVSKALYDAMFYTEILLIIALGILTLVGFRDVRIIIPIAIALLAILLGLMFSRPPGVEDKSG